MKTWQATNTKRYFYEIMHSALNEPQVVMR